MCKKHYQRWRWHEGDGFERLHPAFTSIEEAFWFYAQPGDEPEDHWVWTGKVDQDGYSSFSYKNEKHRAHRYACTLLNGPCPEGKQALHKCGSETRWCVNPNHLAWGTVLENMADREADGNILRGGRSPRAKLTDEIVLAIYHSPDSHANIAQSYGIGLSTVKNIRYGNTWAHLTRPTGAPKPKRSRAKLTEDVVLAIYRSTDLQPVIARNFEVSQATVSNIKNGKSWAWLTSVEP
jgi:transposase